MLQIVSHLTYETPPLTVETFDRFSDSEREMTREFQLLPLAMFLLYTVYV
jgi:hypothetical protein